MLVPLSWLKEFVKTPTKTETLAERLLLSGTKVEEINKTGGETVLNLEITPNRPDTLSVYGVAREIAAIFQEDLKEVDTQIIKDLGKLNKKTVFKLTDKKLMPFYSYATVGGVRIKESPTWLKERLKAAGIRPINNVVDITNYVMIELGQPMHAFDAGKIKGSLTVRAAKKGEKVRTLDSVERELPEGAIIIEDEEKLIDLAGLMGGENSEVDENTTEILLHVPVYDPVTIRKTSLVTNLRTEASNRFEKKLDPNLHQLALNRAIKLLVENANIVAMSEPVSVGYPTEVRTIEFELALVKKVLGLSITSGDIMNLLVPLGFLITKSPLQEGTLSIQIPSHRQDVSIPEDILEEIGRIYGYNNFPKTLPSGSVPVKEALFEFDKEKFVRDTMLKNGYNEVTGYTLVSQNDLASFGIDPNETVKVLHPTSVDFEYLRPTLLINLVKAIGVNADYKEPSFFEVAKEFLSKIDPETKLPSQKQALVFGSTRDYRGVKGVVEYLLKEFKVEVSEKTLEKSTIWNFGVSFMAGKEEIARIGSLQAKISSTYEVKREFFAAWVNYEALLKNEVVIKVAPKPKYPPIIEDISFFVDPKVESGEVIRAVEKAHPLLANVDFLDSFVKNGKTSITLRLYYQDPEKTLTDKEAAKAREKVKRELIKLKAVIRED